MTKIIAKIRPATTTPAKKKVALIDVIERKAMQIVAKAADFRGTTDSEGKAILAAEIENLADEIANRAETIGARL